MRSVCRLFIGSTFLDIITSLLEHGQWPLNLQICYLQRYNAATLRTDGEKKQQRTVTLYLPAQSTNSSRCADTALCGRRVDAVSKYSTVEQIPDCRLAAGRPSWVARATANDDAQLEILWSLGTFPFSQRFRLQTNASSKGTPSAAELAIPIKCILPNPAFCKYLACTAAYSATRPYALDQCGVVLPKL